MHFSACNYNDYCFRIATDPEMKLEVSLDKELREFYPIQKITVLKLRLSKQQKRTRNALDLSRKRTSSTLSGSVY